MPHIESINSILRFTLVWSKLTFSQAKKALANAPNVRVLEFGNKILTADGNMLSRYDSIKLLEGGCSNLKELTIGIIGQSTIERISFHNA